MEKVLLQLPFSGKKLNFTIHFFSQGEWKCVIPQFKTVGKKGDWRSHTTPGGFTGGPTPIKSECLNNWNSQIPNKNCTSFYSINLIDLSGLKFWSWCLFTHTLCSDSSKLTRVWRCACATGGDFRTCLYEPSFNEKTNNYCTSICQIENDLDQARVSCESIMIGLKRPPTFCFRGLTCINGDLKLKEKSYTLGSWGTCTTDMSCLQHSSLFLFHHFLAQGYVLIPTTWLNWFGSLTLVAGLPIFVLTVSMRHTANCDMQFVCIQMIPDVRVFFFEQVLNDSQWNQQHWTWKKPATSWNLYINSINFRVMKNKRVTLDQIAIQDDPSKNDKCQHLKQQGGR